MRGRGWLAIVALLIVSGQLQAVTCPPITFEGLKERFAGRSVHLIFFASWCASCQSHLAEYPKNAVFIATFDEQRRAEAVINHFGVDAPCFTDVDIASHYGIKAVPADRDLSLKKKIEPVALTF